VDIWSVITGVFIGGIGTLILMSILVSGSRADDINLGDRQYEENN
jgi:hypothetical protein